MIIDFERPVNHDVMYGRNESGGRGKLRRICVKVEVAVLGSPSQLSLMVFVDVLQHLKKKKKKKKKKQKKKKKKTKKKKKRVSV